GQRDLLGVCDCGVSGPLPAIAWMGERCGPCHDRREEGLAGQAETPWPLVLKRHTSSISHLAFHGDKQLVSGGVDGRIVRWDLDDGSDEVLLHRRNSSIDALAVSP